MKQFKNFFFLAVLFNIQYAFSQIARQSNPVMDEFRLPMEFDKDSLKGFDEEAALKLARLETDETWRQRRIVAVLKRNFIDFKYGYSKPIEPPTVQAPCTNPDFETGTLAGWTASQGPNNNSLTMAGCCPNTTSQAVIVSSGTDPNISALPRVPPGGGNFSCRLGPTGASSGGTSYRLSQTFTVTPANSVLIYRYAVILNNSPHTCSEQPFFNVSFKDCSGNVIPCGQYNVTAIGSSCTSGGDPSFITSGAWAYKPWTTAAFDLTPYINQCVTLEFTVAGCVASQGAHGGYAYIDASCQPFTLNLNGTDIPVGQTNSSICNSTLTNTLCAPPGFSYSWDGPGVTGQTGQCINVTGSGTYSVTLGVPGTTCAFNPVLYSNFATATSPTVTAALTQPVCALPAGSATLSVSGGTGPYTYSWTPAAPSSSVNTNLPAGTSYSVSVADANGCNGTTSFSIDPYPPAPEYTLAVNPGYVISCTNPSVTLTFASTNTNTTAQWEGPSGIISGTTAIATAPGVYTYTTVNTVSTCSLVGTINITGALNLPVVTASLTQPSCSDPFGSATVTATNGTSPYTYSWTPGTVAAPSSTVNSNLSPGSLYTVSVVDDAGCRALTTFSIDNFSGAPSYTLANSPGLQLTCLSPSTTLVFASTNPNTTTSWEGPSGVITGTSTIATTAGTYTYTAINTVSTCSFTGVVTVTSDQNPPVANYTATCNTNTVNLFATSSATVVTFDWLAPSAPTATLANPASSIAMGTYTLVATNPDNGCVSTYTVAFFVPQVGITLSPNTNILTCSTTSIQATTTPASSSSVIVTWTDGVNTFTSNTQPILSGGTYTTNVQVVGGCSNSSVVTISTNTVSNVSITSPTLIPCTSASVNLTASSSTGGPYTYTWLPGAITGTNNVFPVSNAGTYTVVALNTANGCTATATQAISEETVSASFIADPYQGTAPLIVTFTNTSTNATDYAWNYGNSSVTYTTVNGATIYTEQGDYTVILTATNGFCVDTAVRVIRVDVISNIAVPNVFTPNGDGKNDIFTLQANNMGDITFTVFDRWGLKMFETTEFGNVKWDGKTKSGNIVTDGTYFYIIKATALDGQTYDLQGTINVFR